MVTVQEIFDFLNTIAPVAYKMDFDNVGILAGDPQQAVTCALTALDITDAVIDEAAETGAELIVSHHPLIFEPLRRVTADDLCGRKILQLARRGISAVCMHTNLDIAEGGVNDALMAALGAQTGDILEQTSTDAGGKPIGCGRVGTLRTPMPTEDFLRLCAARLQANGLRYCRGGDTVARLAVCGGSGGSMLERAAALGCDCFVTADVKYDRFLAASELGITLVDAGHFCTENVVIPPLTGKLRRQFPELTVEMSARHAQTEQFYMP